MWLYTVECHYWTAILNFSSTLVCWRTIVTIYDRGVNFDNIIINVCRYCYWNDAFRITFSTWFGIIRRDGTFDDSCFCHALNICICGSWNIIFIIGLHGIPCVSFRTTKVVILMDTTSVKLYFWWLVRGKIVKPLILETTALITLVTHSVLLFE